MSMNNLDRLFQKQVNVYRLQELTDAKITGACNSGSRFILTEDVLKDLHRVAMHKLLDTAGEYRQHPVSITNSPHVPPAWFEVGGHVAGLCHYVNENWESADLVHLCAFVMWRLNWIHPFGNGNGRTSRAASYMVLNIKYGKILPSKNSIAEQIVNDRNPYYQCLRHADDVMAATGDVKAALQPLEQLTGQMLKNQILANL